MFDVTDIARSGLSASSTRMNAAASNLVNAYSNGPLPSTSASKPVAPANGDVPSVYQAVDVVDTANADGGVTAHVVPRTPSYTVDYGPMPGMPSMTDYYAAPNVDAGREIVNMKMAQFAYRANIATMKTANRMFDATLDILA